MKNRNPIDSKPKFTNLEIEDLLAQLDYFLTADLAEPVTETGARKLLLDLKGKGLSYYGVESVETEDCSCCLYLAALDAFEILSEKLSGRVLH